MVLYLLKNGEKHKIERIDFYQNTFACWVKNKEHPTTDSFIKQKDLDKIETHDGIVIFKK